MRQSSLLSTITLYCCCHFYCTLVAVFTASLLPSFMYPFLPISLYLSFPITEGGLVLYAVRLDMGRMKSAVQASDDELISSGISYEEMLGMVRSALDSPYVRRMKMLSKSL